MALRKFLAFVLAVIMVFSMLPMQLLAAEIDQAAEHSNEEETALVMKYDDRLEVSELGMTGAPTIKTRLITSKKVSSNAADDDVVVYVDGKLIAVGVGTAQVTWGTGDNAVSYEITVEPATISLLLVTGHSQAAGSKGNAEESVVCEDGQVYSTYEGPKYNFILCEGDPDTETVQAKDVTGLGIGYGSATKPLRIDALTEAGNGVRALDGALGYQYHKRSGEKVWVLNAAKGSTSLQTWQEGGYNYRHAVELCKAAMEILYNEYQAGHYNVNRMGVVNYTTANGDQTWPENDYVKAFNSMWNGFREELALYDFDGDSKKDTVDCIGLVPIWVVSSMNDMGNLFPEPLAFYNHGGETYTGKVINYAMSAYENEGVIMASTVGRNWTTDADVKAYFEANPIENLYGKLENGTTHTNPTMVQGEIFADGTHYTQLGYNVQGIEIANSMYDYWTGNNALQSVRLLQEDGVSEVPESIEVPLNKSYVIVPETVPSTAKLTYEVTGDAAYYENGFVRGKQEGTGVLTVMDTEGTVLKTVNITITEPIIEEYEWYVWDFGNQSLTNTEGTTTDNTLSLHASAVSDMDLQDCLKDGVLDLTSGNSTLQMSKAITLDTSKAWSVELVAAAKNSTESIRTFLATGAAMSTAKYMYINSSGDLMLIIKAAFTADDGTAVSNNYTYFKVSDEDFAKSKLNSDFDVTQEHKYELRCYNGIISYWLDGEKVGDLALSEQSSSRGTSDKHYTSKQPDYNGKNFNSMTMEYWGTGSNATHYSQGLLAKVKKLAVYAGAEKLNLKVVLSAVPAIEPIAIWQGDEICLPEPQVGDYCAKFLYWCDNPGGTGTTYKAGDVYTVNSNDSVTLYAIWDNASGTGGNHEFENGVCKECGQEKQGAFTWTFEDGTRTSADSGVTLTPTTTTYNGNAFTNGTADVSDGVMNAKRVALELSKAISLNESKGWYIEYAMESNAGDIHQTLLSVTKRFLEPSIVLLPTGNLVILRKTKIDGNEQYWQFSVSDEDFAANMPADFKLTDYHTYRLECNDGVYSYYLDGKKIGDLSCTRFEDTVHEGNKLNIADMTVQYMGNGNSNSNPVLYGLNAKIDKIVISTLPHEHILVATDAKDVTCKEDGNIAYWSCEGCGRYFSDSDAENVIEKDSWVVKSTGHSLVAVPATDPTCTATGNTAYWSCAACSTYYADADGNNEIQRNSWVLQPTGHGDEIPGEEILAACGKKGRTGGVFCSVCNAELEPATVLPALEHQFEDGVCRHCGSEEENFTVWTFDDGTTTSTDGTITLTPVTTNFSGTACDGGTAEVSDGIMTTNKVCLEMSAPLTLSESNDWHIEYSMEHIATGSPQTLLAVAKRYYNRSILLLQNGNVAMMYKPNLDGTEKYWIFTISDEDFAAALPKGFNIADYHTYRLECTGGVYSYWLDGKKIGDLNCTRLLTAVNGDYHESEGNKMDFANMSVQYMGNGTTAAPRTYGLNAKVDKIVICTKAHRHAATETAAKDASCTSEGNTAYWTCNECGKFFSDSACTREIVKDSWVLKPLDHSFTGEWVITSETHTRKCAHCDAADPNASAHVYDDDRDTACNDCGAERTVDEADSFIEELSFELNSSINANFYVNLAAAHQGAKMRFTMNGQVTEVEGELSDRNGFWLYCFEGLSPQCMGDTICAELIFDDVVLDELNDYSVRAYCDMLFASSAEELGISQEKYAAAKTMVADLLEYGAMSQLYRNYKTDSLVNEGITGQSTFVELEADLWDKKLGATTKAGTELVGANVWFANEIQLYFKFTAPDCTDSDFSVKITDTVTGVTREYTLSDFEVLSAEDSLYGILSDPIPVSHFGHHFTVTLNSITDDGGNKTETVLQQMDQYGVNAYIFSKQNNHDASDELTPMAKLARAAFCYGKSAATYEQML
ncbi:MAG: hypothetical protein IKJ74_01140 [Clostridia bacterium]|nr:hypothetical protein [Clostridia bacterium]